jgi:methionyl-tRNA synthetase
LSEDKYLAAKRVGVDADPMALASALEHAREQFVMHFDEYAFQRALETAWTIVARVDKIISDGKPWELAKDEAQRPLLNALLYRAAEALRWLAVLLYPVMPASCESIYEQLGLTGDLARLDPSKLTWGELQEGTRIGEIKPLFPRLDKGKIMSEIQQAAEAAKAEAEAAQTSADAPAAQSSGAHATEAEAVSQSPAAEETKPAPPMRGATEADAVQGGETGVTSFIEIGDFAKVDLRVGEILTAERVPKSDKLLRFTIDIGEAEPRQVLAGIAEYYEPEKMIGRKVVVVANLKPRKLRGFESQGMVVAASVGEDGRPVIATFTEDVPNGARLK